MKTTVTLDDALLERAKELTGIPSRRDLLSEALEALIARESARRLILMGGSDPKAEAAPRKRPWS